MGQGSFQCRPACVAARTGRPKRVTNTVCPSGTTTALEAGTRQLIVAYPDEPLYDVIARMLKYDVGRLPVVERQDPTRAIGYLGRAGILAARAYWKSGNIDVRGAALIALGLTGGAWVSARYAQGLPPATLQRGFALLLVVMAIRMWVKAA